MKSPQKPMKRPLFFLLPCLSLQAQGAIILDDTPRTLRALTPENSVLFDFDGNGRSDWLIQSIFRRDGGIFQIQILTVTQTKFLYDYQPISMNHLDFQPLPLATIIGPESQTERIRYGTPGEDASGSFVLGLPATFISPGDGNFVGETAYLGFRFQGEAGIHYGYALFTDTTDRGTTILATAWESEPGKAIVAGAIPEPSSSMITILGSLFLLRRKR